MLQQIRLIVGTMGQLRGDIHYESNTRLYILSFLILIITLRGKFAYPYCPSETDETQVKLLPQPVSDGDGVGVHVLHVDCSCWGSAFPTSPHWLLLSTGWNLVNKESSCVSQ